jgi:hypothetical protein
LVATVVAKRQGIGRPGSDERNHRQRRPLRVGGNPDYQLGGDR